MPVAVALLARRSLDGGGWATQEINASASHSEAATAACGIAVYTPVGAESAYNDILPADFSLLLQRGEKFGDRLYLAVEDLFKCGFDSVCLIDSDSPTVPAENFATSC